MPSPSLPLETIAEASSDSSQAARMRAMQLLRARASKASPAVSIKSKRSSPTGFTTGTLHRLPKPQTANIIQLSQSAIIEGSDLPDSPSSWQDEMANSIMSPQSNGANDGDDEGHNASSSSVDLTSFPLPPTHQKAFVTREESDGCPTLDVQVPQPRVSKGYHGSVINSPRHLQHRPSSGLASAALRSSPTLPRYGDGAASTASRHATHSVDSALVDAISRSVAEQLRLHSVAIRSSRGSFARSRGHSSRSDGTNLRTSSQENALKRFTKDLHRYAEITGAEGKAPLFTPSSVSPATLRTVSALVPYRREFEAAGLAVTSRDQTERKLKKHRSATRPRHNLPRILQPSMKMSQVDGKDEPQRDQGHSPSTEISFANPSSADEWRYALIDKLPPRTSMSGRGAKWCHVPCLGDTDHSDFEGLRRSLAVAPRITAKPSNAAKTDAPSQKPIAPYLLGSAEPSPRHLCDGIPAIGALDSQIKATGYRHPSMTVAQPQGHTETCKFNRSNVHGGLEIQKHNPRATTTEYLHPLATRRDHQLRMSSSEQCMPRNNSRLVKEISLPTFPFSKETDLKPRPHLRHTLGNISALVPVKAPSGEKAQQLYPRPQKQSVGERALTSAKGKQKKGQRARRRPTIPVRASSAVKSTTSSTNREPPVKKVTDGQVLRGLHIAASAACDENVDRAVGARTGVRLRDFLADLVALEAYWEASSPDGDEDERARQRRAQMRKLKKHVRASRAARYAKGKNQVP